MRKVDMAESLAKMLANGDKREETRLYRWHMSRTISQVAESYRRQVAIDSTTEAEIRKHCDTSFIK